MTKYRIYGIITILITILCIVFYMKHSILLDSSVYHGYIKNSFANTGINNIVTAIYLDYRLFDTLFEALLLLVSIIAIFQFTTLNPNEINSELPKFTHDESTHYDLVRYTISIVYPLFVVLGLYIIYNGADSPGGGFQGGAILATLLMSRYIVAQKYQYRPLTPYRIEKYIYLVIVLCVGVFLYRGVDKSAIRFFMLLMNLLIGFKVCSGFSAIFIKFVRGK